MQVYQQNRSLLSVGANVRRLRPSPDDSRGQGAGGGGALKRGLDLRAGKMTAEEGGDEGVARASGVDGLDLRRSRSPALSAGRGLATCRAALDDDERVERLEPRALG